jgi:hypothetical protein
MVTATSADCSSATQMPRSLPLTARVGLLVLDPVDNLAGDESQLQHYEHLCQALGVPLPHDQSVAHVSFIAGLLNRAMTD